MMNNDFLLMRPMRGAGRTVLCDWGTSRLRAYLQIDDEIVARCEGPGIGALTTPAVVALQEALQPWHKGFDQIVACGMIGSRNGIVEVPYVQAPVGVSEWAARAFRHESVKAPLRIAAGVRGPNFSGTTDVMRGEETQIFGAIALNEQLKSGRHTLLLPGTHSKWVQITEGEIETVQTYITGEFFALLRDHSSLLRAGDSGEQPDNGFAAGLTRSRQSNLAASLFETRSMQLTQGRSRAWASEFLSGLLIGDEVTAALKACTPTSVVLVGESRLSMRYRDALSLHGMAATCLDADQCVIAGLRLLLT
jgi:2-dehydro-3-deoxygalactonokinase